MRNMAYVAPSGFYRICRLQSKLCCRQTQASDAISPDLARCWERFLDCSTYKEVNSSRRVGKTYITENQIECSN